MKILFVNPPDDNPMSELKAIEPPIWCLLLAAQARQDGSEVAIWDANIDPLSPLFDYARVYIVVMGSNPSASSTPKMPQALSLAEKLKGKGASIVLTGLHPMALAGGKDYPWIGYFPSVKELIEIKMPAWDLIDLTKYRAHNWHCLDRLDQRGNYASIYTSFGCPFNCDFCNIHTLYPGPHRVYYRLEENVLQEIGTLVSKYQLKNLKICDELFCLKEGRVNSICDGIIAQGYDLNIWAYARVDTVTAPMLAKMKRAGINWLAYGFESDSADIRQELNKKFTDITVREAIDMTRDAGINIMANFMFGLPGDTEDSMRATLEMAISENFEFVNFYIALPYPGSAWYHSLEDKPTDWSGFNQYGKNICADPKTVQFRDKAFVEYFNRPEYLVMIERKFGPKAKEHIEDMLKVRVAR